MRKTLCSIIGAALVVGLLASVSVAGHNEPKGGGAVAATIVTGYEECTVPNDLAGPLLLPACTPPVRSDPGCGFGPTGKGKGKDKDPAGDVAIFVGLAGLDAGCNGETLEVMGTVRMTRDGCLSLADCTVLDIPLSLLGATCVVAKGKCKIKTTFNTLFPGFVEGGKRTGFQFRNIGLQRITAVNSPLPVGLTFEIGFVEN